MPEEDADAEEEEEEGGAAEADAPSDDALAAEIKAIVAGVNVEKFSRNDLIKRLGALLLLACRAASSSMTPRGAESPRA